MGLNKKVCQDISINFYNLPIQLANCKNFESDEFFEIWGIVRADQYSSEKKRDKLRGWLAAGFDSQTMQWIEAEIEYLDQWIEREEIDEERSYFE